MPTCNHCDAFVTRDFVRVFTEEENDVYACPQCAAKAGIAETHVQRRAANS